MVRSLAAMASIAVLLAGCLARGTTPSVAPVVRNVTAAPVATAPSTPNATAVPMTVPPGRILFHRSGADGIERYFTIKTDGTNETAVYEAQGCSCAHLSADGKRIL